MSLCTARTTFVIRALAVEEGRAFGPDVPARHREAALRDLARGRIPWPDHIDAALRARIIAAYGAR